MRESPSGAAVPVAVAKFAKGTVIAAHDIATATVVTPSRATDVVIVNLNNQSPPPVGLVFPNGYMLSANHAVAVLLNHTANPITLADDLFVTVMTQPVD